MSMNNLKSLVVWFKPRHTDFSSDRLNVHKARCILGLAIFIVLGTRAFFNPVVCKSPPGYTGIHVHFAETQCISASSYFYVDPTGPKNCLLKENNRDYYNKVPIYLFLMAIVYTLPQLLWNGILKSYGNHTFNFIENAVENQDDIGNKDKATRHIVEIFQEILREWKDDGWFEGTRLTKGYLLTKVGYLLMSVLNIFFIKYHLNITWEEHLIIGTHLFYSKSLWENERMYELFPTVVTCKVEGYHALGQASVDYTPCSLNLSTWHRRIYGILFYTTAAMVVINFASLVHSVIWALSGYFRKRNVRFWLKEFKNTKYAHLCMNFVDDHLHADELLVLEILKESTKETVFVAVIKGAFEKYVIFKTGQDTRPNVVNEKTEEI